MAGFRIALHALGAAPYGSACFLSFLFGELATALIKFETHRGDVVGGNALLAARTASNVFR
jgi:hypothetical protein